MRRADYGPKFYNARGIRSMVGFVFNVFLILVGFFFLIAGTYVSFLYTPIRPIPRAARPQSMSRSTHLTAYRLLLIPS